MSEQKEQTVSLTFTVSELNLIFGALQELPFKIVDPLIRNVQGQLIALNEPKKDEGSSD